MNDHEHLKGIRENARRIMSRNIMEHLEITGLGTKPLHKKNTELRDTACLGATRFHSKKHVHVYARGHTRI